MTDVQVKTELTLDDHASDTMGAIRHGFDEIESKAQSSRTSINEFGSQFVATFAAINLQPFISELGEMVHSFIDLSAAVYETEHNTAAMLTSITGSEWGISRAFAEDLTKTFDNLSVSAGVVKSDIVAAQKSLVTFLGGGSDALVVAADNMENLTIVAGNQGLAVQELGSEFAKMASGAVSMGSPVYNLLRNSGIFSSNLSKVNEEWQKLTQQERIDRLQGAFASMAANLKSAPMTFNALVTSIGAIGNEFSETFGTSAMNAFMDQFTDLQGDLADTRGDMRELAAELGEGFGEFVAGGIDELREGIAYVREHADDIKEAVKEGFQFARDTVNWILGHKTELAVLGGVAMASKTGVGGALMSGMTGFGAQALSMGAGAVATKNVGGMFLDDAASREMIKQVAMTKSMSGKFADSMGTFAKSGGPAVKVGAELASSLGGLFSALVAGGPAVWAATAAVTALVGAAVYANHKINEAEEHRKQIVDANVDEFDRLAHKMGRLTKAELDRMEALQSQAEKLTDDKDVLGKMRESWKDREKNILDAYVTPMEKIQDAVKRYAAQAESEGLMPEEMGAERMAVQAAVRLYETAWKAHDDGATKYIANMLAQSKEMRDAFLTSATMTTEGFSHLADTVRELGNLDFSKQIENVKRAEMEMNAKKHAPQVNFNGGQVFKIQQNFRDQDPDRVVIAFEKRFTQAAISRVQATTATPGGT